MSNRYSSLNRRPGAAASGLFADYNPSSRPSSSASQNRPSYAYSDANRASSPYYSQQQQPQPYSTTPHHSSPSPFQSPPPGGLNNSTPTYTPPKNTTYTSTAVLDHLEAQNENTQTSILSSKVSQLKQLSLAIGDEIRDSSSLAASINDSFENTSVKLKGTMRRMLRMAERTGVGWKVWLGFFAAVWLIFGYVWLF